MQRINLYWFKTSTGNGNFGDELNHFIVSRLTDCEINRILIPSSGIDFIYKCLSGFYNRNISLREIPILIEQFFMKDIIIGIGSVIALNRNSSAKVWGSGIIRRDDLITEAEFLAVRGVYTQNRLKELGRNSPEVIGDPALLLPLLYKVKTRAKFKLGIIPHYIHYDRIKNGINSSSVLIVNLLDPIEKVLNQILSCEFTISTSLHGIIVSQAYKIPSLWYRILEKPLTGDSIKFYDYFSSVGIDKYEPFELSIRDFQIDRTIKQFELYEDVTLIKNDLSKIQQDLINVAPFRVLDKYFK
ncbi:polysaccharide pyruvyl transferase family protein [Eudoraea chungangensis]|uniref:polysaccharide pyruvyl transferase family protein n=1 Tax=Eudoraea chungangensis TaxID=1481905 RepID=UPI0023EBBD87|nr:polysaccharide pyruvyl transferase family protein [Eudoraea chungangensis]